MAKDYTFNRTGEVLGRIPDTSSTLTELQPLYPPTVSERALKFISRHNRVIAAATLSAALLLATLGCTSNSETPVKSLKRPATQYELAPGEVFIPSQRVGARTPEVVAHTVVNSRDGISTEATCYVRGIVPSVTPGESATSLLTNKDGDGILDMYTFIPAPLTKGDGLDNPSFGQTAVVQGLDFEAGEPVDLDVTLRRQLAQALSPDVLTLNDGREPRAGEQYFRPTICVVDQTASTPS